MLLIVIIIFVMIILLINKKSNSKYEYFNNNQNFKIGDYVTTDLPNLKDRFNGFYKIVEIRKVDWSNCSYDEGDALTFNEFNGEYWSKYFHKKW